MSEVIRYSVRDHVATVVLNRPERLNAYNQELSDGLIAALLAAEADSQVRAVVLTGSGRAFCARLDLKEVNKDPSREIGTDVGHDIRSAFFSLNVPLVAAINGPAIGISDRDRCLRNQTRCIGRNQERHRRMQAAPLDGGCQFDGCSGPLDDRLHAVPGVGNLASPYKVIALEQRHVLSHGGRITGQRGSERGEGN